MAKMFVENLWALLDMDQDKFVLVCKADNDSAGWNMWNKFIKDLKISTAVNKIIDKVLTEHEWNAYQVMGQHNT